MDNDFTSLENTWKKNKESIHNSQENLDAFYKKTNDIKKQNFQFYYGNIIILSITLIGILSFFYFVAPVQTLLSRIGASLMVFGLLFRIIIEIISTVKSKKIHIGDSSLNAIENTIAFHKYRKKIHSVLTPIIIALYTIGFYMITPEFLIYLSTEMVIFYDIMYLVFMVFLFFQIRKGIRKEMRNLELTINLKKELKEK